jgi:hypothetical protein
MLLECFTASTIYGITPVMEKYILQFIEIESFIVLNGLLVFLFCATYWIFFHKNRMWKDIETVKNSPTLIVLLALTSFLIYIVANFFYIESYKTPQNLFGYGNRRFLPNYYGYFRLFVVQ